MTLIRQLDNRRKFEEREKKKHQVILRESVNRSIMLTFIVFHYEQMVLDKLIIRERKLTTRKRDTEILTELRKPQEDSEIVNQKDFPALERIPGLKLTGQGLSDLLMVFEFLHNFGETLGFGNDRFHISFFYFECQ